MNLLKYTQECRRLERYKVKCMKLGPCTPESISKPIMSGLRNCLRKLEIMERTMVLEFNLKGNV
jgi:hypothetical protein